MSGFPAVEPAERTDVSVPGLGSPPASVRAARDTDAAAWDAFVERQPAASVFHRWAWRSILERSFGFRTTYLVAERAGALVGILPLAEVRSRLFGNALVSLPFCTYGGPVGDDEAVEDALAAAAAALAEPLRAGRVEFRLRSPSARDWARESSLYFDFERSIGPDHEANMNAIPRKQRAMVRKGIKNALTASIEPLDVFYELYADNVHRHGTPAVPKAFFANIAASLGGDCEILVVRTPAGMPISGVLTLYHRDQVFPFYAGDRPEARDLAANDFKYWAVMRRGADRGCTSFNYGRSKRDTGPFHFKKNWGFEPKPLHHEYRLPPGAGIPQNNPLNPRYRLMIETWRRLPRWMVDRMGPLLVRGLG